MKRIAIVAATAVLAGGAGFAITDSLGSSGDESPSAMSRDGFRGGHPGGGPPPMHRGFEDDFAAALAEELGISEERVTEALDAVREDLLSQRRP